jgi:hypothetical protein
MKALILASILTLATCLSCVADGEKGKAFDKPLKDWQAAWNTKDADKIIALFHPESRAKIKIPSLKKKTQARFTAWIKTTGAIKDIRFIAAYDKGTVCATQIDFEKIKGVPVVFKLKASDKGLVFYEFLPGSDPTRKADNKVIGKFLKEWQAGWNSGDAKFFTKRQHPLGKLPMTLAIRKTPVEQVHQAMKVMVGNLGPIESYKVEAFKARTNEYIITFTYKEAGDVSAAMNIQKDAKGIWQVFSMDINDGERALKNPNSWYSQ